MGKTLSLLGLAGVATLTVLGSVAPALAQSAEPQSTESQATDPMLVADARSDDEVYPDVEPLPTIPQRFQEAFYSHDGNFFDNRGIWQGFRLIFGIPNYVENSISQDGRAVHKLYTEVIEQQLSSDPVLRTPDLPNPYTGSVLTTPLVITEEPIYAEPFPTIRRSTPVAPAPGGSGTTTAPSQQREAPVPALW